MFLLVHSIVIWPIDVNSQNFNNGITRKANIQLKCWFLYDCLINSQLDKAIIQQKSGSDQMIPGQRSSGGISATTCRTIHDITSTQHTEIHLFKQAVSIKHI